ncbi:MAG: hypothetical protein KIT33_15575 [Candidatus Kapabacteria bacterium]|nr:hypothetical protein [Ignavibacteriota bacterium]MCW5886390.1 hypothetical protein [Candidatus Kapabacteria bacterium]
MANITNEKAKYYKTLTEPIYEKQPNEPIEAFEAFQIYRDLGPKRNAAETAKLLVLPGIRPKQIFTRVQNWMSIWKWQDRVAAYKYHIDEVFRHAMEESARDLARKHAKLAENYIDVLAKPAEIFLLKYKENPEDFNDLDLLPASKLFEMIQKSAGILSAASELGRKTHGMSDKHQIDHTTNGNTILPSINITVVGSKSNLLQSLEATNND